MEKISGKIFFSIEMKRTDPTDWISMKQTNVLQCLQRNSLSEERYKITPDPESLNSNLVDDIINPD